jgi:hypothetical protein
LLRKHTIMLPKVATLFPFVLLECLDSQRLRHVMLWVAGCAETAHEAAVEVAQHSRVSCYEWQGSWSSHGREMNIQSVYIYLYLHVILH